MKKARLITGEHISEGNMLVGLASSGIHSNGYSLVRKVFFEDHSMEMDKYIPELNSTLGEALLTPTKIYVKPVLEAMKKFSIKGMSHITGGGFIENIPRMLPDGLGAAIYRSSWEVPAVFNLMEEYGGIPHEEMFNIFNMGIGFVIAVDPSEAEDAVEFFKGIGEEAYVIGEVTSGDGVRFIEGEMQED